MDKNGFFCGLLGFFLIMLAIIGRDARMESHTRLYQVTDYEIQSDGVEASYTLEDGDGFGHFNRDRVFLHEGEDTLIIISWDENGKGFDGVKEYYLYLNEDGVTKKIKERGGL